MFYYFYNTYCLGFVQCHLIFLRCFFRYVKNDPKAKDVKKNGNQFDKG